MDKELDILRGLARLIDPNDPVAHNNLAVVYYQRGLYKEAIEELEKALELNPDFELAKRNLKIVLKKMGRYDILIEKYKKEIERKPDDVKTRFEFAKLLLNLGKLKEALEEYKEILDYSSDNPNALIGISEIYRKLGYFEKSEKYLLYAKKKHPDNLKIRYKLAELYYQQGELTFAQKELKEVLKINPKMAEAHLLLSFVYGELGMDEEALKEAQIASQLNPKFAKRVEALVIEAKDLKTGETLFDKEVLKVDKKKIGRLELAKAYLKRGLYDDALRELKKVYEENPNLKIQVDKLISQIYFYRGKYEESFEKIRDMDDKFSLMLKFLILLKKNEVKDAFNILKKLLEKYRNDAYVLFNLASFLILIKRKEQAMKILSKLGDRFDEVNYILAYIYYLNDNYKKAEEFLEKFLKVNDKFYAWDLLARVKYSLGFREEAKKIIEEKVLKLEPKAVSSFYFLAYIYGKEEQYAKALDILKKAVVLSPNYSYGYLIFLHPDFEKEVIYEIFSPYLGKKEEYLKEGTTKLIEKAKELLGKGKIHEASSIVEEILNREPYNFDAVKLKIKLYELKKEYSKTLIFYKQLDELGKLDKNLQKGWIICLIKSGRYREGLEKASIYIKKYGKDPDILKYTGYAYGKIGEWLSAEKSLLQAISLNPTDPESLMYMGQIYFITGEKDRLEGILKDLEKIDKDFSDYLKGEIAYYEGNLNKAKTYLKKVISNEKLKSRVYYLLGLINAFSGNYQNAIKLWEFALYNADDETLKRKAERNIKRALEWLSLLKKELL